MKFLTKYENIEAYSNEAFRLPYPNVSLVKGLPNKKLFYREEPAWVKCVYEIPSEAFESTSAVTVLNSVPGYINDYKINGVYGEVEQLRVEEGVEVEVFQSYTMEGMQVYLPTTDACFLIPNLSTETEFTLSRPLNETDIILQIIYNGSNELVDIQTAGTVADFGENIHSMFLFRSDTIYTYSDYFLETIKEQESTYEGMKLGFFFVNGEWYENPLEVPSLTTTIIGNVVHGGVQQVEVLPSMLDDDNKVTIEYSLLPNTNTINGTFRNIDYLKEIDFTRLNSKNNSKRKFQIVSEAFIDCSVLETVKIGNHIVNIGFGTFDGCISLPVIDGIRYADTYCVGTIDNTITSFSLKEDTKWIGDYAFNGCSGLTGDLIIPDSMYSIGNHAFNGCSGLTGDLIIPDSMYSIGNHAFYGCSGLKGELVIPDLVTTIGEYAFYFCSGLTGDLIIPDSVTSIGSSAFIYCSGLTSVVIGNNVTSIGHYTFKECSGLTGELVIPDSVKSIGIEAFAGCSGLTSVVIGNGCTSIDGSTFYKCTGLESILVSSRNTVYDSRENCNCIIETDTNTLIKGCSGSFIPNSVNIIDRTAFYYCSGLTGDLIIPDSVTKINDSAFYKCSGLTSVVIGNNVTSIGMDTFIYCSGLKGELVIPDSVTSIGSSAFAGCSGLTSVTIGSGCTSIGMDAFRNCSKLEEIFCHAVTAPSITNETFRGVKSNGILYVPSGSDYSSWMSTSSYYLGYYKWTIQYIS